MIQTNCLAGMPAQGGVTDCINGLTAIIDDDSLNISHGHRGGIRPDICDKLVQLTTCDPSVGTKHRSQQRNCIGMGGQTGARQRRFDQLDQRRSVVQIACDCRRSDVSLYHPA